MKITLIAMGTIKKSVDLDLFNLYAKRLPWKINVIEKEVKKPQESILKQQEAEIILGNIPNGSYVIALDERGKQFTSLEFSTKIQDWQNKGYSHMCFIIGGAFGLDQQVRDKANLLLSLSAMTFPHMLVRGLICEQLYRSYSILNNHPYHKE